jgi:hypothetical protein
MSTSVQRPAAALPPALPTRAEPAPVPRTSADAAAEPEITRQDRVIVTIYAVMAAMVAAFLATTLALWWFGV